MEEPETDIDEYVCSECGGTITSEVKVCPHCGSDTSESIDSPEDSLTKSSNRAFVILTIAVAPNSPGLFSCSAQCHDYHLASLTIKLIVSPLILYVVILVIVGVIGKSKSHILIIFVWLFLALAILDFGVATLRKFVVEPQVRRTLE